MQYRTAHCNGSPIPIEHTENCRIVLLTAGNYSTNNYGREATRRLSAMLHPSIDPPAAEQEDWHQCADVKPDFDAVKTKVVIRDKVSCYHARQHPEYQNPPQRRSILPFFLFHGLLFSVKGALLFGYKAARTFS
jgi:hypothetical protein